MWTPRDPLCLLLAAALAACGNSAKDEDQSSVLDAPQEKSSAAEPEHIAVDHILIGVKGGLPNAKYSAAEARKLAYRLLDDLKNGADWAELKRRHSDDPPPGGPYAMSNDGVMPRSGEYPRRGMVPAFGNVGFKLEVGEIGIADYDPVTSKYGYHIIKRVR